MTDGIVYLFTGPRFAERMIVSQYSLRKHWDGPVTVFCTEDDSERIMRDAAETLRLDVERKESFQIRRHSSYITKTLIPTWTPYDRTLFLDGDTTVHGDFRPLFEPPLAITQFCDWQSQGRKVSGRISRWRGITPAIDAMVDEQLSKSYPAINTGVFAWHHGYEMLATWHALTVAGGANTMTDELAMQLLFLSCPEHKVFSDTYNWSPLYSTSKAPPVIVHYHGSKHVRKEAGKKIWWPIFEECRQQNIGGIAAWAGKWDKYVRRELAHPEARPKSCA